MGWGDFFGFVSLRFADPFPDTCDGLGAGARFCLACSAISCHFENISLPPTACRAAKFVAVVLILSSSSLLGCKRLSYLEKKRCQTRETTSDTYVHILWTAFLFFFLQFCATTATTATTATEKCFVFVETPL